MKRENPGSVLFDFVVFTAQMDLEKMRNVCSLSIIRDLFDEMAIATTPDDSATIEVCNAFENRGVWCYRTDAFHRGNAAFNKGAAVGELQRKLHTFHLIIENMVSNKRYGSVDLLLELLLELLLVLLLLLLYVLIV